MADIQKALGREDILIDKIKSRVSEETGKQVLGLRLGIYHWGMC